MAVGFALDRATDFDDDDDESGVADSRKGLPRQVMTSTTFSDAFHSSTPFGSIGSGPSSVASRNLLACGLGSISGAAHRRRDR